MLSRDTADGNSSSHDPTMSVELTEQSKRPGENSNREIAPKRRRSHSYCYRHRPEALRTLAPFIHAHEAATFEHQLTSMQRETLTNVIREFTSADAGLRTLMLSGILMQSCIPQLSYVANQIMPLLRVDIISCIPHELALRVLTFLDACSLCRASQVSRQWHRLANDDRLWHRLCEQHIDKICTKCGWGLPLMHQRPAARFARMLCKPAALPPSLLEVSSAASSDQEAAPPPIVAPFLARKTPLTPTTTQSIATASSSCNSTSSTTTTDHTKTTLPSNSTKVQTKLAWKGIYAERMVVARNWRQKIFCKRLLEGHTEPLTCLFLDGQFLATGSQDKTIRFWNVQTGECLRVFSGHQSVISAVQFDQAKLVTGDREGLIRLWHLQTGECIRVIPCHTAAVLCLHFNDRILASGSSNGQICVLDCSVNACVTLELSCAVTGIQLYGRDHLFSGSEDGSIRLWDWRVGGQCVRVYEGIIHSVTSFHVSPFKESTLQRILNYNVTQPSAELEVDEKKDGPDEMVMAGGEDGRIVRWNSVTGAVRWFDMTHQGAVNGMQCNALRMVTSSLDGSIVAWDCTSQTKPSQRFSLATGLEHKPLGVMLSDTHIATILSDSCHVTLFDFGFK